MIVFLGIEIMSVAVYVLAGLNRRSERSAEGASSTSCIGAFSTAFLLLESSRIWRDRDDDLATIGARVQELDLAGNAFIVVGVALLLVGFGFKVAAVPFHMWAPDVYEGAPTPTTAYMAAAVKAGAFVAFLRVWLEAFPALGESWHGPVWCCAD